MSQKWGAPDTPPKISPENPLKKWWVVWFFSHETTSVRRSSSWSLESPEMEVLSANSMGNFTGPCESAKGGWSCNQRTTWDEFSVKPLSSPPLLSIMTKIIPIFTPHQSHGLPETTFFLYLNHQKHTQATHFPPGLTFTDHIGHNALRRVVGCRTAITHQLVQVTRAESPRCFSCALEPTIGVPMSLSVVGGLMINTKLRS